MRNIMNGEGPMNVWNGIRAILGVVATVVVVGGCSDVAASDGPAPAPAEAGVAVGSGQSGGGVMTVYLTPTCGCCGAWVEHMEEEGFTVETVYQNDLSEIRRKHRLPPNLTSCHMGIVDGFAVEGHVPAATVRRMLADRPEILGIAAPGMPIGSPGMEHPDGLRQPYDIIAYDANGRLSIFEEIR
jgi:hypothetical protein